MSWDVGCTHDWDPVLLWCRPVATAPIRPLAWEPPYAVGVAQEITKKKKKRKKNLITGMVNPWDNTTTDSSHI